MVMAMAENDFNNLLMKYNVPIKKSDGGFLAGEKSDPVEYRPLNFDNLIKAGAVRVTNRGNQDGTADSDSKSGFSLVSGWNDAQGGNNGTKAWPNNEGAYSVVREMFAKRPTDIADYKYRQILWSAQQAGLKPEDIFLPVQKAKGGPIEAPPALYSDNDFNNLLMKYFAGDARGGLKEAIAALKGPEAQGASSPSWEGIGEGFSAVGQGFSDLYSTPEADLSAYTKAPDRSVRRDITPVTLGEELNAKVHGAGSPSWEDVGNVAYGIAEDPFAAIGGALPVVGNMLAAADVSKLKDKIAELRASGDNEKADLFQRYLPLAAAGVVMPAGGGLGTRAALKGAEKAALKAGERGVGHALESAIEREAGHIPLELGDLKYATSQEGPYYRVTHEAHPRYGSVSERVRQEVGGSEAADAARGGRDAYTPPQLPSYEDIADLIGNVETNVAHQAVKKYLGRELVLPNMPESSLQKQSAIGRTFALAAEESPAYKRAIFKAYKEQMPEIVEMSGAKNYDELLAASYNQMAKETSAQFDALPLDYSFHRNGEGNYANSKEMLADLHGNKHMRVFQGGDPHDFLKNIDPRTGLNENEKFRAVHDAFGHGIFGNTFKPAGEELAWGTHSQMYSPLALPAMTAETRGQNSFVNYTPINAKLKEQVAKIESRIARAKQYNWKDNIAELEAERAKLYEGFQYAPQKSLLLPPEFLSPDYAGGMPEYVQKLIKPAKGTTSSSPLTHFSNEYGLEQLDPTRYGTGIGGDESTRLMKASGEAKPGAVRDRSYFYLGDPSSVIPEEGLGHHVYTSSSKNLYDASKDPLDFNTLAIEANRRSHLSNFNPGTTNSEKVRNDFERMIKEYGYEGIANPDAAFPMAAVFNPKDVTWTGSTRQTVNNPVRYAYGDVYNNPRILAAEAESRVAPEDPLLKQLFGVSRDDLYQIAKDRKGNMEPTIQTISGAKVPPTVENIMTDRNKQRLQDAMGEFLKQPGLRTGMVPWYVHDPVYQRLVELVGPDEANQRFKRLNVMMGMMSPGSPVQTELNRGLGAHYLNEQNRIEDFYKYGGQGQGGKSPRGVDFPPDLESLLSHPYHSTSHAMPLRKYIEAGYPDIPGMESPKVPLYMQASGVPETGFQTKGAVPDAHWTRGMGLPDTRTSKGFNQSMNMREYQHAGPWFRENVAEPLGMEAVPAQALMWGGFSGATGVDTLIGAPKIELLAKHIRQVAKRLKVDVETARDLVLTGKAYSHGGEVKNYAQGGSVKGYALGGQADIAQTNIDLLNEMARRYKVADDAQSQNAADRYAEMVAAINSGVTRGDNTSQQTPTSTNFTTNTPATVAYDSRTNDLVPYSNTNYQPGAVQSYNLSNLSPSQQAAVITSSQTNPTSTQTAATTPTTNTNVAALPSPIEGFAPSSRGVGNLVSPDKQENQMFSDSGKFTGRIGDPLPGSLLPAFEEAKGMMGVYGTLPSSVTGVSIPPEQADLLADWLDVQQQMFGDERAAAIAQGIINGDLSLFGEGQMPNVGAPQENFNGSVAGTNLAGTFDPLDSPDVLGDINYGTFGLSGPMGLSNAIQETQDQQEAAPEAEGPEDGGPEDGGPEDGGPEDGGPEDGGDGDGGYALGGTVNKNLMKLYRKYSKKSRKYAQGGPVAVYDPAEIDAIAASIREGNYA
jgi:hypothetical protein